MLLELNADLQDFLRKKVQAAIIEKNLMHKPVRAS
jgi:hypothetical protein